MFVVQGLKFRPSECIGKTGQKKAGLDPVLKPRERHFLWFTYQLTRVSSRFSETLGLTNKIEKQPRKVCQCQILTSTCSHIHIMHVHREGFVMRVKKTSWNWLDKIFFQLYHPLYIICMAEVNILSSCSTLMVCVCVCAHRVKEELICFNN